MLHTYGRSAPALDRDRTVILEWRCQFSSIQDKGASIGRSHSDDRRLLLRKQPHSDCIRLRPFGEDPSRYQEKADWKDAFHPPSLRGGYPANIRPAMGAASLPPVPCSRKTTTTISGRSAGA